MFSEFERLFSEASEPLRDKFGRRFLFVADAKSLDAYAVVEAAEPVPIMGQLIRTSSVANANGRKDGSSKFRTTLHGEDYTIRVMVADFGEVGEPQEGDVFQDDQSGIEYRVIYSTPSDDGWLDCSVTIAGG